jgi:sec-independent protein translocase protein TatA
VSVGPLEIVIVLVLALLVFGPKGLPQAGRSLGHAMREFRKATQTARTELGLDEVTEGIKDLKSSMNVDLGLNDIKSSMSVDLDAASAAAVVAPAADKPVPVTAASSDTTPAEAAAEPAVDEPAEGEAAGDDTNATGASAGGDDA